MERRRAEIRGSDGSNQLRPGCGKAALMMVPGLPERISKRPPNCKTRSRIPAIPTPSFFVLFCSSATAPVPMPMPSSAIVRKIWSDPSVSWMRALELPEWR